MSLANFLLKKNEIAVGINPHKISLAPMMDITNKYFRVFMRMLTKNMILYTEMIHENTIILNPNSVKNYLDFYPVEHPIVCQLGGSNPETLKKAAILAEHVGYDEININIGCPSPKVQEGSFGACLMKDPERVIQMVKAMQEGVKIPVTVKTRLGIDDFDSYEFVKEFIEKVSSEGGVKHFIMHARKAFLKGLNPSENRNIPPLNYEWVVELKKDFPHLKFSINGGFTELQEIEDILNPENNLEGCMIGRVTYNNPWLLSNIDSNFFNTPDQGYSRRELLEKWKEFGDMVMEEEPKTNYHVLNKPIINIFNGERFSSKYKQFLSVHQNFINRKYSESIDECLKEFSSYNPEALDLKPNFSIKKKEF